MAIDFSVVGSCSVGCNERWRGRRRGPALLFWWGETVWSRCLVTHVEFKDTWNIGVIYLLIHYSQRPWKPRFSAISRMLDGEEKTLFHNYSCGYVSRVLCGSCLWCLIQNFCWFCFFCIKAHCTVQVKVNAFFFDSETHAKETKAK